MQNITSKVLKLNTVDSAHLSNNMLQKFSFRLTAHVVDPVGDVEGAGISNSLCLSMLFQTIKEHGAIEQ